MTLVVDRWNYDEIMITGGEPLLFVKEVADIAQSIRFLESLQGIQSSKIYVYTASCGSNYINILPYVDGIVLTPHNKIDVEHFIWSNEWLINHRDMDCIKDKSLRLNLFPDIKALLPKDIDLSLWQVKDMEWIENCPIPEGEDFRRIANLW